MFVSEEELTTTTTTTATPTRSSSTAAIAAVRVASSSSSSTPKVMTTLTSALGVGTTLHPNTTEVPTHRQQQLQQQRQSNLYYIVSGGLAGMVEHVSMFPLDTIKTRLQAEAAPLTLRQCVTHLLQQEGGVGRGARALYRGVAAGACGAFPSHAAYFTVYERIKAALLQNSSSGGSGGGGWLSSHSLPLPVMAALAGAGATVGHDCCHTPFDVVKQRLQVSPAGTTVAATLRSLLANEGVRALYVSLPATLAMNVPFAAAYFATYEAAKRLLHASDEDLEQSFWKYAAAGGLSGAAAAVVSNPFDVIKTRQQLGTLSNTPASLVTSIRAVFHSEGVNLLTRGVRARVLYFVPSAAVQMTAYEGVKRALRRTPLYNPNAAEEEPPLSSCC